MSCETTINWGDASGWASAIVTFVAVVAVFVIRRLDRADVVTDKKNADATLTGLIAVGLDRELFAVQAAVFNRGNSIREALADNNIERARKFAEVLPAAFQTPLLTRFLGELSLFPAPIVGTLTNIYSLASLASRQGQPLTGPARKIRYRLTASAASFDHTGNLVEEARRYLRSFMTDPSLGLPLTVNADTLRVEGLEDPGEEVDAE